jgi:DNA-binding NarL/FixJ family response regulator
MMAMLRSRDHERVAIDRLLESARAGRGGGFVLRGEPGIGKSALLADARERAVGMRVLNVAGVEAESSLAFAALHQLLRPVQHHAGELPAPQRQALRIALGLEAGSAPDRFLISLASLTLLSDVASQQPILCVLDDAHWADEPSLEVVRFVARRLETEPIALLASARSGEGRDLQAAGLHILDVPGLGPDEASALLDEHWGAGLVPTVRDALVVAANGNPLALIELPRALTVDQRAGRSPLPEPLPLAGELEQLYARAIDQLEPEMQTVALVCAAAGRGSLEVVGRAAARLGVRTPVLELPGLQRVLRVEHGTIDYRHPLMRSAAYQRSSPAARRAAHLALADTLVGGEDEADRRAWHRAAAALGPDEAIAGELERAADRTLRRSGYAAAVHAMERAADLSPSESDRVRRMVAAAEAAWHGGDTLRARGLVQRAEQLGVHEPRVRLHARYVQGSLELRSGVPADGLTILLDAVEESGSADPPLAVRALAVAGEAGFQSGELESTHRIGSLLAALPETKHPGQKLLLRLYRAMDPTARARELAGLHEELAAAEQLEEPEVLIRVAGLAFGVGEYATARRLWTKAVAGARALGAAGALAGALRPLALDEMARSRYAWAEASAAEGRALALETGQPNLAWQHAALLAEIAGIRGQEQDARALADDVLGEASRRGLHGTVALMRRALGHLALAWGQPEEAIGQLEALWGLSAGSHRAIALAVIPDLVEAAVRAGRPELARTWLARLPSPDVATFPEARALIARSKALLASADEADSLFREALRAHATTERPLDQARTALLYGEHLRRERRRVDAREPLRSALETFERLGAAAWAERARGELRATGETARKREPSSFDRLTRQELQVVRVVGQGATNREVAAQLFISPRTVDHHLRSIFQKLGISSRSELIRLALAGDPLGST